MEQTLSLGMVLSHVLMYRSVRPCVSALIGIGYCSIHMKNQIRTTSVFLAYVLWGKKFHWHNFRNEKEKRKMTPMLPPVWIKVFLHFRVGLSLYVILKRALWELKAQRLLPPVEGDQTSRLAPISSKGEAPKFPDGWLKLSGSPK
jgi:hypothetical protein